MFTKRKDQLVRRRTLRAIRKHAFTVVKQMLLAAVVDVFWYFVVWSNGWRIEHGDGEIYLTGVLLLASAAWVLKATETFRFVLDQHRELVRAVKSADVDTIIDLKDDHIPLVIPSYLSLLSIMVEVMMMAMPYHSVGSGLGAVFVTSLILFFYGGLIYELEDPMEGGWVRDQLLKHHPALLTVDSEEVFANRWRRKLHRSRQAKKIRGKP